MSTGYTSRLLWLALATAIVFVAQILVGSMQGSISDWLQALWHPRSGTMQSVILYQSRLPAAIAASLAGAALGVSGLLMQTYFRNPIAGPYVLGVSSGASLGAATFIMLFHLLGWDTASEWGLILAASIGAAGILLLVMALARRISGSVVMLITGLMIASFTNGVIEVIQSAASAESIRGYLFWTMGSFRHITPAQIPILAVASVIALLWSISLIKPLNLLLAGDEQAQLGGLDTHRVRWQVMLCTALLAGSITAFCGPVGFVGLAAPHLARALFRTTNHQVLIPTVMLTGAAMCGSCNILTGINLGGWTLPLSTVTSLLGAPIVIWIVYRNREIR
jgi:iron complex transport system permease protein